MKTVKAEEIVMTEELWLAMGFVLIGQNGARVFASWKHSTIPKLEFRVVYSQEECAEYKVAMIMSKLVRAAKESGGDEVRWAIKTALRWS